MNYPSSYKNLSLSEFATYYSFANPKKKKEKHYTPQIICFVHYNKHKDA